MADKEYVLGNKARELLVYTNRATKPVQKEVPVSDVTDVLKRIAALENVQDVRNVCTATVGRLESTKKEGFSERGYKQYGEEMCSIAKGIVRDIHAANGKLFATEHADRLKLITQVLDGCALMLEYIVVCHEMGYISMSRMAEWTKKVTDVKYMAASWKKNDGARARKLEAEEKAAEERRLVGMIREAVGEGK